MFLRGSLHPSISIPPSIRALGILSVCTSQGICKELIRKIISPQKTKVSLWKASRKTNSSSSFCSSCSCRLTLSPPSHQLGSWLFVPISQWEQGLPMLGCGRMRRRQGFTGACPVSQQFSASYLNGSFLMLTTHSSDNPRILDATSTLDESSSSVSLDNLHKIRDRWPSKAGQTIS